MAQNPYADIFGRLIEYSFQKKLLEQRIAEQRKMFEEQQKAAGRLALASQLTKEAESTTSIADPETLGKLTSTVPGIEIEVNKQAEDEIRKKREEAIKAAAELQQGKNVENAPQILSDLINLRMPALRKDEGGRTYVDFGNARIILSGTSEEAAQKAANVKAILMEADTKNKLKAEQLALETKMESMFGKLPEDPAKKEPLYNMFNEFNAALSTFGGDPLSRAAAITSFAGKQLADIEGSGHKDDPAYKNYAKFLMRTIDASNAVVKAHAREQSAAARSQDFNERVAAAAYALWNLVNKLNKGLPTAKVDYGQFVSKLGSALFESEEGQALGKKFGPGVMAAAARMILSMLNPTMGQMTVFPLPNMVGGQ